MTAAALRPAAPHPGDLPPGLRISDDGRDRRLLAIAIAVAVGLHVAVVLLPFEIAPPELPTDRVRDPIRVTKIDIPPPKLDEVETPAAPAVRRIPIPAHDPGAERPAPIEEPPPAAVATVPFDVPDLPLANAPPPPVPAGPVPEGTPGLDAPVRLDAPKPQYPRLAMIAGVGGQVVLRAVIDRDGAVRDVRLVSAPRPDLGFSEAAIDAVSRWSYRPGQLEGREVAVELTIVVSFSVVR